MNTLPTFDFLMLQLKLKGIWQHRSLGQHFLTDKQILERIAQATGSGPRTLTVEIGPGPGTLTSQLAARAGAVLAIELDHRLQPLHRDAFGIIESIEFLYQDAMKVDLAAKAREAIERLHLSEAILTGNLPFQITSPLLFEQCTPDVLWQKMVVMIQKEVANRICAKPGNRDYGILTVKLAYWWRVAERFEVEARKFFPQPKVDASVLVFERQDRAGAPAVEEWEGLSELVDAAFGQRRKMLFNSLAGCWKRFPGKEKVQQALEQLSIPIQARAETLSSKDFLELYRLINH